ncbi:hypothetical protein [Streptomyces sp. NPDC054863]
MRRTPVLLAGTLSICGLAAGGGAGYTWWQGSSSPSSSHALCAPDLSRPGYVAAASENVALVTVTGKQGYAAEERTTPGGVQTVAVRTDKTLKGTPPGTFRTPPRPGRPGRSTSAVDCFPRSPSGADFGK